MQFRQEMKMLFQERDQQHADFSRRQLENLNKEIVQIKNSNPPASVIMRMKFKELMIQAETNREADIKELHELVDALRAENKRLRGQIRA